MTIRKKTDFPAYNSVPSLSRHRHNSYPENGKTFDPGRFTHVQKLPNT